MRFKSIELAHQFKAKFEEAKAFVKEAEKAKPLPAGGAAADENNDDDVGAQSCDDDDTDDDEEIRVLYEKQITLEEKQGLQYAVCSLRDAIVYPCVCGSLYLRWCCYRGTEFGRCRW